MIYKHKRTGVLYRRLMDAFQVESQKHSVVYVSMETGQVFCRELGKFMENFDFIVDPQCVIEAKEPHS